MEKFKNIRDSFSQLKEKLKNISASFNQLSEATIGETLENTARKYPEREAVKYPGGEYTRTWKEFNTDADNIAKSLLGMGFKKGDHIAVWATNYPQWMQLMYGAAKVGIVLVPLNTNYRKTELENVLRHSDAKALFYCSKPNKNTDGREAVSEINVPRLQQKICFDDGGWDKFTKYTVSDAEYQKAKSLPKSGDVANIQYTSGTTGEPKGVMLTHHGLVNNAVSVANNLNFTEKDRLCIQVPFMHCFGISLSMLACITKGSAMVPLYTPSATKALQACHDERCTALNGTPTMFIDMLKHEKFKDVDFSNMRTGIMAGASCPEPIMCDVMEKMNMRDISIVYGLTESSPGCTQTQIHDSVAQRVSSVGRSLPHVKNKIVKINTDKDTGEKVADQNGMEAPNGEPGEFWTSGYHVMKGYYKNEEATKRAIHIDQKGRRWLRTGDMAERDDNGNFKIKGRIKDVIIRGGENIYPADVEAGILKHEAIKNVQVVGVPDARLGEQVCAIVVTENSAEVTESDIRNYLSEVLARHEIPAFIQFRDSFDDVKTASGKIQKYKLRQEAVGIIESRPRVDTCIISAAEEKTVTAQYVQ